MTGTASGSRGPRRPQREAQGTWVEAGQGLSRRKPSFLRGSPIKELFQGSVVHPTRELLAPSCTHSPQPLRWAAQVLLYLRGCLSHEISQQAIGFRQESATRFNEPQPGRRSPSVPEQERHRLGAPIFSCISAGHLIYSDSFNDLNKKGPSCRGGYFPLISC